VITAEFCRVMARYGRWQNANLTGAADTLSDAERGRDRGAFFGSIEGTLNHLLWADTIWMSRIDGWIAPRIGIPESPRFTVNWAAFKDARRAADARILDWAMGLEDADLQGDLAFYSNVLKADVTRMKWHCIQHVFNHQTHHRGQVHAMLTAAGVTPGDTDLFVMPEDA